jgi:thiamine transport system ATP-binding protein
MLNVNNISVSFNKKVLDRFSIDVDQGEIVGLQGPSGSGKTTLLRVVAGLIKPDSGTVSLDGKEITHVPTYLRGIGMVFQDNQLFPHMNVEKNIGFGLKMHQIEKNDRAQRISDVLELAGLSGFNTRDVHSLSGGEAKRVALARSLVVHPRVLLLDEPLTGLDRELHDQLANDIAGLLRKLSITTILVTHDQEEAEVISDRIEHIDR